MIRNVGRCLLVWILLAAVAHETLPAQQLLPVRFEGQVDDAAVRRFVEVLDRGTATRIEADTVLGPAVTIGGDLLIMGADVRLSGTISGDVIAVDSDLFLRPGARVEGSIVVLGGGFYSSQRAEVVGDLVYRPDQAYSIERRADAIRIVPVRERPETLTLHGLSGIKLPTYQRVDEWTLALGATLRPLPWRWEPALEAVIRLKTEDGDLEGTLRQTWTPGRSLRFGAEAERVTRTNDAWMRGNAFNSLAFFLAGDDVRNYYEADRLALFLRGTSDARWAPRVEVELEEAKSLGGSEQFVLFGSDPRRPNPMIDEGTIVSARVGGTHRRVSAVSQLEAAAFVEAADSGLAGDFTYTLAELTVEWTGPAIGTHGFEARLIARRDLSGAAPRQRWSAVGGLASLPTEPELARRGSRLFFGEATYVVPIQSARLGMAGVPSVFGRIAVGDAWNEGSDVDLETNLVAGLRISFFELGVAFDPTDDGEADVPPGSPLPPDTSGPTVFFGLRL